MKIARSRSVKPFRERSAYLDKHENPNPTKEGPGRAHPGRRAKLRAEAAAAAAAAGGGAVDRPPLDDFLNGLIEAGNVQQDEHGRSVTVANAKVTEVAGEGWAARVEKNKPDKKADQATADQELRQKRNYDPFAYVVEDKPETADCKDCKGQTYTGRKDASLGDPAAAGTPQLMFNSPVVTSGV